MNWHNRYKTMKSGLKITNSDIAEITGLKTDTIKNQTQPNYTPFPKWLKLAIVVFERLTKTETKQ